MAGREGGAVGLGVSLMAPVAPQGDVRRDQPGRTEGLLGASPRPSLLAAVNHVYGPWVMLACCQRRSAHSRALGRFGLAGGMLQSADILPPPGLSLPLGRLTFDPETAKELRMKTPARVQVLIRMDREDKTLITRAAKGQRLSVSAFVTAAALALSRRDAVRGLNLLQALGRVLQ